MSLENCERITLDTNVVFFSENKVIHLGGIAIAEVKSDAYQRGSAFLARMHTNRIQPCGFSKYCIGVSMLFDRVKKNALKPKMLLINKLSEGISNG